MKSMQTWPARRGSSLQKWLQRIEIHHPATCYASGAPYTPILAIHPTPFRGLPGKDNLVLQGKQHRLRSAAANLYAFFYRRSTTDEAAAALSSL